MAATGRWRTALQIVAHGQACSALTALTGATATLLAARGVAAPTALSAPMYMLLASLWCGRCARAAAAATQHATAAPKRTAVREAGAWLLLAVVDVEAQTVQTVAVDGDVTAAAAAPKPAGKANKKKKGGSKKKKK